MKHNDFQAIAPPPPIHINVENVPARAIPWLKKHHPAAPHVQRQRLALLIHIHFDLTVRQISRIVGTHPSTTYRDIQNALFHFKRTKYEARVIAELYDYILYNTRYLR